MKLRDKKTNQLFVTTSESTIKAMLKSGKYEKVEEKNEEQDSEEKQDKDLKTSFSKGTLNDR